MGYRNDRTSGVRRHHGSIQTPRVLREFSLARSIAAHGMSTLGGHHARALARSCVVQLSRFTKALSGDSLTALLCSAWLTFTLFHGH